MPNVSSSIPLADYRPERFPTDGVADKLVLEAVASWCAEDHSFGNGTILNSICTEPLPVARRVSAKYAHTNLVDNRLFPSLHAVQRCVTRMLGELVGDPSAMGTLTSGGTEANLLAVLQAIEGFTRRTGVPRNETEIIIADSAHYSFAKIAAVTGVRLRRVGLDARFRVKVAELARAVNRRTAAIVVTAGTSECGAVDDVAAVARIAARHAIWLHVDAATGGFLIPFLENRHQYPFDFRVPGVVSLTLDPHKYGYAPIPAGYLLRRASGAEFRGFVSHYHGTVDQPTLLSTRPGGALLAVYACLVSLGWNGYQRIVKRLVELRERFLNMLAVRRFELAFEPDLTVVGIRIPKPVRALRFLEDMGFVVSVSKRFNFLRVVLQDHLSPDELEAFADALVEYRAGA